MGKIDLAYYCGHKKVTSLIDEPEKCTESGEIEVDEEDWNEGNVCINCPACGAFLDQSKNHFTLV